MRTFNVFDGGVAYDPSDPEPYRAGAHRFGPEIGRAHPRIHVVAGDDPAALSHPVVAGLDDLGQHVVVDPPQHRHLGAGQS